MNYLPIVELKDWLQRDGLEILVENEVNKQNGQLKGMLRQAGVAESLPLSVPLQEIAAVHFPRNEGSKSQKNTARGFHNHVTLIDQFRALVESGNETELFEWFREKRKPEISEIVHRLGKHSVLGHYFFETLSHHEAGAEGFVCLLREVSTVSKPVAEQLGKGLDAECLAALYKEDKWSIPALSIPADGLAMPITEIGSPTLEHVLQAFSHLFGRIGVAEPDGTVIGSIVDLCLNARKGTPK